MNNLQLNHEEMFNYYKMNFQSLFSNSKDLDTLALKAVDRKKFQIQNFDTRIKNCAGEAALGKTSFATYLKNWDTSSLKNIATKNGGLLCGLFHFGAHRHFLLDTVCEGIDTVSPIAGKAYDDLQNLARSGNNILANKIQLLDVEEGKVGRNLLRALRSGRIGGIYVDGNMGPSSQLPTDDCVYVNFFGKTFKVKAGIARLSLLLNIPILPVFCSGDTSNPSIHFGKLISPPDKSNACKQVYYNHAMQSLYLGLQEQVKNSPENWEYALCMHRWISSTDSNIKCHTPTDKVKFISINSNKVSFLLKDRRLVIVNTERGKGFKVPSELTETLSSLFSLDTVAWERFKLDIERENYSAERLLEQMLTADIINIS